MDMVLRSCPGKTETKKSPTLSLSRASGHVNFPDKLPVMSPGGLTSPGLGTSLVVPNVFHQFASPVLRFLAHSFTVSTGILYLPLILLEPDP